MALGNRENTKTSVLQLNGQAMAGDNRYSEGEAPGCFGQVGEAWATDTPLLSGHSMSDAIEKVMERNRILITKIEILNMKADVDLRNSKINIEALKQTGKQQSERKERTLKHLQSVVGEKETKIKTLSKENEKKNAEITRLQQYVNELKKDVEASKKFADDIQQQLDKISGGSDIKRKQASTEKENEIVQLRTEVNKLKEHLATLENELTKAKGTVEEQQGLIRLMENDRNNIYLKFEDDLQKVQVVTRKEIENMREVITEQWQQIREIRAQNTEIQNYVGAIGKQVLPSQNVQTSAAESNLRAGVTLPVLPTVKKDGSASKRGGRKHEYLV